jgi:hypothetical protein
MIGFCPLDEEEPRRVVPRQLPPRVIRKNVPVQSQPTQTEQTECNYAVLFFIVGVVVLALSDNVK